MPEARPAQLEGHRQHFSPDHLLEGDGLSGADPERATFDAWGCVDFAVNVARTNRDCSQEPWQYCAPRLLVGYQVFEVRFVLSSTAQDARQ